VTDIKPSDAGLVMTSFPDGTGAMGKSVADESPIAAASATRGENGRADAAATDNDVAVGGDEHVDPWFAPGPKVAASWPDNEGAAEHVVGTDDQTAEWFLPTGRAALLPDSITQSPEGAAPAAATDRSAPSEAVGSPPWAGDPASIAAATPPPWENGPWPGPADRRQAGRPQRPTSSGDPAESEAEAVAARRRPVQLALAGAAGAVVLIVVIVVLVTTSSGGPTGGCGSYPAAVRQAYVGAMTALRTHAPLAVQSAAFQLAASRANSSAAGAGQIGVRTALFAMASDLDQAHADMTAHRALPPALLQHLAADGSALPASCPS
jgi:hypothetical protein